MIKQYLEQQSKRISRHFSSVAQTWLMPVVLRRRTFRAAFVASVIAACYWGVIASDRYVSEAHVLVQNTDVGGSASMDFTSILTGSANSNQMDQFLLRDYLLSNDMLKKLDSALDLRTHYSNQDYDIISRMWDRDVESELFHNYFLSRVHVDFDERAGFLVVKAEAYEADMAHSITSFLVKDGENFMNTLAHRLAQEQVTFLESQVEVRNREAISARQRLLAFQNKYGLVSPQGTVESIAATINSLEGQLTAARTQRGALLGYLSKSAPAVVEVDMQIKALKQQIADEKARLASTSGSSLNVALDEYQRLQMEADFALDVYKTAIVALEQGRVEATRMIKKVSILQAPSVPQYPLEPRRIYNTVVFLIIALLLAGVVHLIAAIIRDHKD